MTKYVTGNESNRPGLGIDIDETIVWLLPDFLKWRNSYSERKFSLNDFKSYRWWETFGITKGQAYEEAEEYIRDYRMAWFQKPEDFVYALGDLDEQLVPQTEAALELLASHYELYSATDRNPLLDRESFELSSMLHSESLADKGLDGLLLSADKIYSTIEEGKTKAQIYQSLGIKKAVDDNPDVAVDLARNDIQAIVLARPWNENIPKHPLISRVPNWRVACEVILGRKVKFHSGARYDYRPVNEDAIVLNT